MAVTATISMSPSTVQIDQPSQATLTLSNSGGSAVSFISAKIISKQSSGSYATDKTPFAASTIPNSSGFPTSIPAGGSLILRPSVTWFEASSSTYDVSAIIQLADGSYVSPGSPATVTVNSNVVESA